MRYPALTHPENALTDPDAMLYKHAARFKRVSLYWQFKNIIIIYRFKAFKNFWNPIQWCIFKSKSSCLFKNNNFDTFVVVKPLKG